MLIRTSGTVQPNLYLLTLGHTCRYAIGTEEITLTDPGAGIHAPLLLDRLRSLNLSYSAIHRIVVTHLRADTLGAIPSLRTYLPNAKFLLTSAQAARIRSSDSLRCLYDQHLEFEKLGRTTATAAVATAGTAQTPVSFEVFAKALTPDTVVADSEMLECPGGIRIRLMPLPGHTPESVGFMVEPSGYLIGDAVLGYYRGRNLAAPGCDDSLESSLSSLHKIENLPLLGLCLSTSGVIAGELVRKHLQAVILNTTDLGREVTSALKHSVPKDVILRSIEESFYLSESRDPFVQRRLKATFDAVTGALGLT